MCNVSEREGDRETGQETGREREREREGVIERERASGRERGSEQARSRLRQHESDRERPSVASSAHSRHGRAPLSRASIRAGVGCSAVVAHACFLMCVLVSAMLSSHTCSVAPLHSPTVFACSAGQQTRQLHGLRPHCPYPVLQDAPSRRYTLGERRVCRTWSIRCRLLAPHPPGHAHTIISEPMGSWL